MARDYTAELLPAAESFEFCDEYAKSLRIVLIAVQGMLKLSFPGGAAALGLVIEYLDRSCRCGKGPSARA